jgi:hypothetical protein
MSRSLQFDIVANDKASAKLKDVQGAAGKFATSIAGMAASFFGLQAVLGRVVSAFQQAFTWGSELKNSAAAVGVTVEQFQQLQYAAQIAGVPVEKMQKAFLDLRKVMRDATDGNEQAVRVLKAMGYSQEDIAGGNIDLMDAFLRVSKAISSATSEQERFNIATAVFGDKVAMDLMKALGDYGELKKNISETPLISKEDAEVLDKAGDTLDKAWTRIKVNLSKLIAASVDNPDKYFDDDLRAQLGMKPRKTEAASPTETDAKMAKALADAGKKSLAAGVASAQGQSALAAIGGAAGYRAGGGKTPELTALEAIEANTRPAMPTPINGSTNFSGPSGMDYNQQDFASAAARIRSIPRRRDIAPR